MIENLKPRFDINPIKNSKLEQLKISMAKDTYEIDIQSKKLDKYKLMPNKQNEQKIVLGNIEALNKRLEILKQKIDQEADKN